MKWGNMKRVVAILIFIIMSTVIATAYVSPEFNDSTQEFDYPVFPPSDTISEGQIKVYSNQVIIYIPNVRWASYLDTDSMSPVLDENSHGIEIIPKSAEELHKGDIVAYETKWNNIPVVHRIVDIKEDELGTYYILKGDNNEKADPVKVRFEQIKYKLVAIIY